MHLLAAVKCIGPSLRSGMTDFAGWMLTVTTAHNGGYRWATSKTGELPGQFFLARNKLSSEDLHP
jgi:hypothetical protein